MGKITYKDTVKKAYEFQNGIKKQYKLVESTKWDYYIAKAILNPHHDIQKISVAKAKDATAGDYFSRQITKAQYLDMCKRFVKYVEKNNQLPNTIKIGNKYMGVLDYTNLFTAELAYYDKYGKAPKELNISSKAFTEPTEDKNTVFKTWVNTFKFTPKYIDDVCDYIMKYFTYLFYYDDKKSNEEVIKTKSGNCTDLLQMLCNMAEAMGYEWKVHHVECNQSGVGHVYGLFRKAGVNNGNWFIRDIACIADESRYCIWCEANNGGSLLATNPSWFTSNLKR